MGLSAAAISQVLNDKYPASTDNIARKVLRVYGSGDKVTCPRLGQIEPSVCAEKYAVAKRLGLSAGNPETIRLRHACRKCVIRS